ncbi:hypothetical protein LXL04_039626 [Taraxacum kok-saghyz]
MCRMTTACFLAGKNNYETQLKQRVLIRRLALQFISHKSIISLVNIFSVMLDIISSTSTCCKASFLAENWSWVSPATSFIPRCPGGAWTGEADCPGLRETKDVGNLPMAFDSPPTKSGTRVPSWGREIGIVTVTDAIQACFLGLGEEYGNNSLCHRLCVGPHSYVMAGDFQAVVGLETREQAFKK